MDVQLWFIAVVFGFVLLVWLNTAARWGFLAIADDESFTIRTLLGQRVRIPWGEVRGPVEVFESFCPRAIVTMRSQRFFTLTPGYAILLRGRPGEREVLARFMRTIGVKHVGGHGGRS